MNMYHPIYRIIKVSVPKAYWISVQFDDGTTKEINLESILYGEMYGPLRDAAMFMKAEIDPVVGTLQWPNGADFDPAILYHWEDHAKEFIERAREWA